MSKERFQLHQLGDEYDGEAGDTIEVRKLSLEDTLAQTRRGLKVQSSTGASGYNPYDTFPNTTSTGTYARHKDLRELSEWIRMKRQVEKIRKEEED